MLRVLQALALLLLTSCSGVTFRPNYTIPIPNYERPSNPVRVALVLGGGGSRSLAHVGVIEELLEANIPIDLIVGTSSGGIIGALYADTLNIHRVKSIIYPLKRDDLLDYTLTKYHGLVTGIKLRAFLKSNLYAQNFEELKIPLIVTATDLLNGEMVCFGSGPMITAIHGSCAVPGIFCPVYFYGRYLVDGGAIDPVPVETAIEYGADIVIAVDIGEELSDTYPETMYDIMMRSFSICYKKLSTFSTINADIVIKPVLKDIGLFNEGQKEEVYQEGRRAAREAIPKIREIIDEK